MEVPLTGDKSLILQCDWKIGIGGSIWTNGLLMVNHLKESYEALTRKMANRTVLELGSGTGLVGLTVATLTTPSNVFITDLESQLGMLNANIGLNSKNWASTGTRVHAVELVWGQSCKDPLLQQGSIDFILGMQISFSNCL